MSAPRIRLRWARRFLADTRAVAAGEMALVLPIVGFITLNIVDLATYMYSKMQVDLAAEQAAGAVRKLCLDTPASSCGTTYATQMTAAAQKTTLGNRVTLVGTPTEKYYCADASGNLVLVATPPTAPPATCTSVVSGSTAKPGSYIKAVSSYTYAPIFPGVSVASYLSTPVQSAAWMRLQ